MTSTKIPFETLKSQVLSVIDSKIEKIKKREWTTEREKLLLETTPQEETEKWIEELVEVRNDITKCTTVTEMVQTNIMEWEAELFDGDLFSFWMVNKAYENFK